MFVNRQELLTFCATANNISIYERQQMIHLAFMLHNPFPYNVSNNTTTYVEKIWRITKNKRVEFQVSRWSRFINLIGFELDIRFRGINHAGCYFNFDFWGYTVLLNWYDRRHWNYQDETWEEHP